MFAFYFAILSAITPPVALAVFAAAGIAKADLWATGWAAVRIAATSFIVPFMFVYEPALLMIGDWPTIIWASFTATIGIMLFAAGLHGYFLTHSAHWQSALLVVAGLLLIDPHVIDRCHRRGPCRRRDRCASWRRKRRRRTQARDRGGMNARKRPEDLRSHRWLGVNDLRSFGHRSRLRQGGYDAADWGGKPVIGIVNTWSDINSCHAHLRARAEDVKRGVLQAGGFPVELPAMSLSEPFVKPSTMLYRNLLAMETEELLRSHPIDGAVLMGGCDKTTPGLIMGAISMGLPAIYVPAGPLLRGNWRGQELGSGSDAWKYWDEKRAGNISEDDWDEIEGGIARSFGTCMVMGTAATMMAIAEALGLALPGASSIPAADAAIRACAPPPAAASSTWCGRI